MIKFVETSKTTLFIKFLNYFQDFNENPNPLFILLAFVDLAAFMRLNKYLIKQIYIYPKFRATK